MQRRLVLASAIAVVVTATVLSGSGAGASAAAVRGAQAVPAGLADAIHARFGAGAIRRGAAFGLPPDGPALGFSVAVSADGTTALVGAYGVGNDKGAAYIFHVADAASWASTDKPTATLKSITKPLDKFFGESVALSADGTTAAIGAPLAGASGAGAIYVFHASAEDAWASSSTPTATLTAASAGWIGRSVALSSDGTTLVVGDPFYNGGGGAHIFRASSEDAWTSTSVASADLSYTGESKNDLDVGDYVAISGDGTTALVSDNQNLNGGEAYVFHVASEASWGNSGTPTAILSNSGSGANDYFGGGLALSSDGTVALVGAPGANGNRGAVDVFHASSGWASTSTPTAILTKAGSALGDSLGLRVALSSDGTTALVAVIGFGGVRGAGSVFHVADESSWASTSTPTATLTDAAGHAHDAMGVGTALSADGATAFLGAPEVRYETGAVKVFHVADAASWASTSAPNAVLTNSALNQCVVPALRGKTVAGAKAALLARSCRLGTVTRVVWPTGRRGRVVAQSLKPLTRHPVGTRVSIKVKK